MVSHSGSLNEWPLRAHPNSCSVGQIKPKESTGPGGISILRSLSIKEDLYSSYDAPK